MALRLRLTLCALLAWTCPSIAGSWLKAGGETSIPFGHAEYCARQKSECGAQKERASLAPARMALLRSVNVSVNRSIRPVADAKQYGRREVWTRNAKAGDCEDYALTKRARLLKNGYKPSDLRLTMARLPDGEAHTVLVVRTASGDYVLDNLEDRVLRVDQTRLRFVKMQSAAHGARWVSIRGKTSRATETGT